MREFIVSNVMAWFIVLSLFIFCMILQIGFYSLFVGCLFLLSDYLIGSTLFAWNHVLLGGLVIFFIKLVFGSSKGVKVNGLEKISAY